MSLRGRLAFRGLAILVWGTTATVSLAGWGLTTPGDPNRNWHVSVSQSGEYDDNWNATENDRVSGLRGESRVSFRANVPMERLFAALSYDYDATYPQNSQFGGADESHNVNLSATYTASPRLTVGLNETFVESINPGLVQNTPGVPGSVSTITQAGTYRYNNVGGNLNYDLGPRWSLAANGNWDFYRYEAVSIAATNNRSDYQATVSALYLWNERTTTGLNFQYSINDFNNPGSNDELNAQSYTGYFSMVRRFNPRLSLQVNSGYTYRVAGDGNINTSPFEFGSIVYAYGPANTIAASISYSLSEANVGDSRLFSASQNTSATLSINHKVTPRLDASMGVSYVYSTFLTPIQTFTLNGNEQQLTVQLTLTYGLQEWLAMILNYQYSKLTSNLPGLTYDRDQISLGLRASY